MKDRYETPCSPLKELDGILYLPRLLDKIRLRDADTLHPEYHTNLGLGMDLWTCQYLGVDYHELEKFVTDGASDEEVISWIRKHGVSRPDHEKAWFRSYMLSRGFRDDMAKRLAERKKEDPQTDRDDILTFMDYIDVDEGRELSDS